MTFLQSFIIGLIIHTLFIHIRGVGDAYKKLNLSQAVALSILIWTLGPVGWGSIIYFIAMLVRWAFNI
jgi:hypothetical protein